MKKFVTIASTIAALSFAVAMPSQAFDGLSKHTRQALSSIGTHGRHQADPERKSFEKQYGYNVRLGRRRDCAQIGERAELTGNAYWFYAYDRCRFSHYKN